MGASIDKDECSKEDCECEHECGKEKEEDRYQIHHHRVYHRKKLVKITTIVYLKDEEMRQNETVTRARLKYGATVFRKRGTELNWNRRNHIETAKQRFFDCPVVVEDFVYSKNEFGKALHDTTLTRGCCSHYNTNKPCPHPMSVDKRRKRRKNYPSLSPRVTSDKSSPQLKDHTSICHFGRNNEHKITVKYQLLTDSFTGRVLKFGATVFRKECYHDCWNRVKHLETARNRFDKCAVVVPLYDTWVCTSKNLRQILHHLIDTHGCCRHSSAKEHCPFPINMDRSCNVCTRKQKQFAGGQLRRQPKPNQLLADLEKLHQEVQELHREVEKLHQLQQSCPEPQTLSQQPRQQSPSPSPQPKPEPQPEAISLME